MNSGSRGKDRNSWSIILLDGEHNRGALPSCSCYDKVLIPPVCVPVGDQGVGAFAVVSIICRTELRLAEGPSMKAGTTRGCVGTCQRQIDAPDLTHEQANY